MKCLKCGSELRSSKENHRYTESGLDNVILEGVEVRRCSNCGEWEVVIPRLAELHRAIARRVATERSLLQPQEIRFLRKYLGYSGVDFASAIGVAPETISRWENGDRDMSRVAELLLRTWALHKEPLASYPAIEPSQVEQLPKQIDPSAPAAVEVRVREKKRHWRAEPRSEA